MSSRIAIAALVASAIVGRSDAASAEATPPTTADALSLVENCTNPHSEVSEEQRRDAIEHYNRGAVFYEQGDYDSAVDEFVAAYCDAPHPQMFFNIGQSFERLLDFETAVAYFERFIANSAPSAANLKRARVRVRVLRRLPARVRVATVPAGAQVSLRLKRGLAASGKANAKTPILAPGGTYSLEVESPGYEPITEEVTLAIGQPYSYYFQLERKKGVLRVFVEPSTARIFVDDRLVGLGSYSETVDIGRYQVRVEAPKREPISREVVVTSDRTSEESFRLPQPEGTGRWELVTAGGLMGLFSVSAPLANLDLDPLTQSLFVFGGLGVGLASGIIAVPRDIPISRASFIITSGLIGGLELGFGSALLLCDTDGAGDEEQTDCSEAGILGAATGGLLGGVVFGALTSGRFKLDAGDAAILNSGMLWGTAVGSLFYAGFDRNPRLVAPLILAGLNLGIVSGITVGSRVDVSRRRIALIDLAGVGGAIVGFAAASALDAQNERIAHSALAGVAVGLIGGTLLTRFMDEPDDIGNVKPVTSAVRDVAGDRTTTLGAQLTF